jgi:hypothetical protein
MYPTIAQAANAENFALLPEFADAQLEFLYAEMYRVDSQEGFSYHVTAIDTARADIEGHLRWSGEPIRWEMCGDGIAKEEGGAWTVYDKDGKEVLPTVP